MKDVKAFKKKFHCRGRDGVECRRQIYHMKSYGGRTGQGYFPAGYELMCLRHGRSLGKASTVCYALHYDLACFLKVSILLVQSQHCVFYSNNNFNLPGLSLHFHDQCKIAGCNYGCADGAAWCPQHNISNSTMICMWPKLPKCLNQIKDHKSGFYCRTHLLAPAGSKCKQCGEAYTHMQCAPYCNYKCAPAK